MDTSKIIKGAVSNGRYTVTAPIVKEDYGLYLQIEGVELPSTYEVDFSNSENSGTSVTMIGNADGVLIPSQFISTGKDVFAFLYHVGEDFGRTVYKFRIPNKVRPDRTNEEPTPEEQSVIDQAIGALNEAVAQTAQDVISADQSARSASDDADRAERARDAAEGYASNAQESAQASAQSATASANSATTAQGYASNAQLSATQASNSARSANQSASDALTFANTASNKATEASTSAQTASAKATESAQSASQALTYKTDAESAKTASQTAQGLAESARDSAISAKTDAESARDDAETARDEAQSAVASISGALAEKAPVITDTASSAIASFSDGADNLPLKSLVVDINPIQDLSHGDPSPENLCPISGWTEVDVEQMGKNLFNPNTITEGSFIRAGNTSDAFPLGGVNANDTWNCSDYIPVLPSTQYAQIVPYHVSASAEGLVFFASKTVESAISGVPTVTQGNQKYTFTTPSNCHYIRVSYNNRNLLTDFPYPVVALGSDVSGFIASDIHSITIQLGQTVYGGKLDVLSGVLTAEWIFATKKWGQMSMVYNGSTHSTKHLSFDANVLKGGQNSITNITDTYMEATTTQSTHYYIGSDFKTVYVTLPNDTNTDTDIQVCGTLAEPIEIQLSANQLNSLYGVNNLWADSGDTEVEYRADTKAWIQRKIAEAIASLT